MSWGAPQNRGLNCYAYRTHVVAHTSIVWIYSYRQAVFNTLNYVPSAGTANNTSG